MALALLLGLFSGRAAADDNHYQNLLVGDRAAGLGGAFTAISDDSSGAYYNPAGLSERPYSSLSLSAAFYGFATRSYAIEAVQFESVNRNFVSYPTTAAWIQRLRRADDPETGAGRIQLAVSLLTPQSDVGRQRLAYSTVPAEVDFGQKGVMVADTVRNRVAEDDTLWAGAALSWKVFRHLALGLGVFVTYRAALYQTQDVALARYFSKVTKQEFTRVGLAQWLDAELTHLGLVGTFGVLVPITDHFKVGASVRSPSIELHGRAKISSFATTVADDEVRFTITAEELEGVVFHDRQPLRGTLGLAYVAERHFGVALDFSLYGPVGEYPLFESDDLPQISDQLRLKKKMVWQLNVGGEYYIVGRFPLRAGFFTNRSSYDPVQVCAGTVCGEGTTMVNDPVDVYGVTAAVGWESERVTLNLGAAYSFGSNESRQQQTSGSGASYTVELKQGRSALYISVGGAFRFK